ncbi:hypothetical protein GWK47_008527 [Chionoecetes opilio]|uniref:Uncharacterized protein n=1 Tax=Chionoecetes opilio TaxID=41210 RepID=A0A8J5CNJ7_CHIOP|nr:hypothetical protein GWK47_008527 [Chionoecetes opilio]
MEGEALILEGAVGGSAVQTTQQEVGMSEDHTYYRQGPDTQQELENMTVVDEVGADRGSCGNRGKSSTAEEDGNGGHRGPRTQYKEARPVCKGAESPTAEEGDYGGHRRPRTQYKEARPVCKGAESPTAEEGDYGGHRDQGARARERRTDLRTQATTTPWMGVGRWSWKMITGGKRLRLKRSGGEKTVKAFEEMVEMVKRKVRQSPLVLSIPMRQGKEASLYGAKRRWVNTKCVEQLENWACDGLQLWERMSWNQVWSRDGIHMSNVGKVWMAWNVAEWAQQKESDQA